MEGLMLCYLKSWDKLACVRTEPLQTHYHCVLLLLLLLWNQVFTSSATSCQTKHKWLTSVALVSWRWARFLSSASSVLYSASFTGFDTYIIIYKWFLYNTIKLQFSGTTGRFTPRPTQTSLTTLSFVRSIYVFVSRKRGLCTYETVK